MWFNVGLHEVASSSAREHVANSHSRVSSLPAPQTLSETESSTSGRIENQNATTRYGSKAKVRSEKFESKSSNFKFRSRKVRKQYSIPKLACTHVGSNCSASVATLVLASPRPRVAICQSCMENAACRLCNKTLTAKHDAILFDLEQPLPA